MVTFLIAEALVAVCFLLVNRAWGRALRAYGLRRHGTLDLATVFAANLAPGQWLGFRALAQHQGDPELEALRRRAFWWMVAELGVCVAAVGALILAGLPLAR